MRFEELVEVLPHFGHPLDDFDEVAVLGLVADLGLDELPTEVAAEETLDRLHVVGAQNPAEVVVQLQVGG